MPGVCEAVDVEDEGGEDGGGDGADAGDGVEVVGVGQGAIGGNQQVFQAFLPGADVAELADLVADQFGDGRRRSARRSEARACSSSGGDVLVGQIGDGGEVVRRGRGQQLARWGSGGRVRGPSRRRCP